MCEYNLFRALELRLVLLIVSILISHSTSSKQNTIKYSTKRYSSRLCVYRGCFFLDNGQKRASCLFSAVYLFFVPVLLLKDAYVALKSFAQRKYEGAPINIIPALSEIVRELNCCDREPAIIKKGSLLALTLPCLHTAGTSYTLCRSQPPQQCIYIW